MKKSKFFAALAVQVAAGATIKSAADVAGCSVQTAYNLSSDHAFRQRVAAIRSEATTAAVGKLSDAAVQAVDTMRELLGVAHEPSIRLNASKAILAALVPMTEFGELRARVQKIESESILRYCNGS